MKRKNGSAYKIVVLEDYKQMSIFWHLLFGSYNFFIFGFCPFWRQSYEVMKILRDLCWHFARKMPRWARPKRKENNATKLAQQMSIRQAFIPFLQCLSCVFQSNVGALPTQRGYVTALFCNIFQGRRKEGDKQSKKYFRR